MHILTTKRWWYCGLCKLNASGQLRSDQANVGRNQKLGKVVGIFQIIMRKLIKCCIQFGLAKQTNKSPRIFKVSSRYVRLSTIFNPLKVDDVRQTHGIERHRCVCFIVFPHMTRLQLPNFQYGSQCLIHNSLFKIPLGQNQNHAKSIKKPY